MPAWLDKLLLTRGRVEPASMLAPVVEPELSAEAHRLRGNRWLDEGRLEDAAASYRQALARDASSVPAAVNLGYVLLELGRTDEAKSMLQQALAIDTANVDAHFMLGRIAVEQGDHQSGIANLEQVVQVQAEFALAYVWLCRAYVGAEQYDRAESVAIKGLQVDQQLADLHRFLGNLKLLAGDAAQAIVSYRAALALQPRYAEVHTHLGHAFTRQGQLDAARVEYLQALQDKPGSTEACQHLGEGLQAMGLLDQAAAAYRMALEFHKDHAPAHQNLGAVYQALGRPHEAVASYERAAQLQPDSATAWCNLGAAHQDLRRIADAQACYRRAMVAQPDHAAPHAHMATLALDRGEIDSALSGFERALELDPGRLDTRSHQLFALSYIDHPERYLAAAREYGRRVTALAEPFTDWLVEPAPQSPRPATLRVGLVSGDLRNHPVGFFIESVLERLARHGIALCAFPTSHHEDEVTARLKSRCANWTPLIGMCDAVAARRIRDEQIHILIDLAGHTGHNRLSMFAWRPAPVQVSWLGYFASTGVPAIDYLLGDDLSVPDELLGQFTESVWRLPDTRLCFTEPGLRTAFPVAVAPAVHNGFVTLGSYQTLRKVNQRVLEVWRQVMEGLPQARLRLQSKQTGEDGRAQVLARLEAAGIDPARVVLAAPAARASYLASYAEVDLLLDTFPFPGGTTTCEALWMGVPTVTLPGSSMLGNQGKGMLTCAGLPDWVAEDEADYVRLAIAHGSDIAALARLRATLRERVVASPLMDSRRFAEQLASALFAMWQRGPNSPLPPN